MHYSRTSIVRSILLAAVCVFLLPSIAAAETKKRTCGNNPGHTLQHFLKELNPGDTLIVSGTCKENVVIGEGHRNITIDGQNRAATIDGSGNLNAPAVTIRGRGITIKGFTIIGGRHGVQFNRGGTGTVDGNLVKGATTHGVGMHNGSFATIVDNTIQNNGVNGICVCEHSVADIGFRGDFASVASPNVVHDNGSNGIYVGDASYAEIESNHVHHNSNAGILIDNSASAKIGFRSGPVGTFASTNTVEKNGNRGIMVLRSSSARIVENVIRDNTGDGVGVFRGSQADIAANAIDNNSGHGISVNQNSGVNLGSDIGTDVQDQPNTGTGNFGVGVRCLNNSSADGRLGSVNGNGGTVNFDASCVNSLIP